MRVYLAGPMDRVPDGGVVWRQWITPLLQKFGMVVIDPCDKPIDVGTEGIEDRKRREELIKSHNYDAIESEMRTLRCVDLAMVDMGELQIVYWDMDTFMCGTEEETFWANRMKNPILIMCPQGKDKIAAWMLYIYNMSIRTKW
jgi:hypothetical protein